MKNIWQKNKAIIMVICYVLFIAASVNWLFLPSIKRIREGADEIQRKNLDGEIHRNKIIKIRDMERDVEIFKRDEGQTDVFVGTDQEVGFIEKLEDLAEKTNNQVSFKVDEKISSNVVKGMTKKPVVSDSSKSDEKDLDGNVVSKEEKTILDSLLYKKFFYLQISLKGDNQSVMDFIRGLESSKKYSNVVGLNLSLVEENPDGSPVNSNIFSFSLPSGNQSESEAKVVPIKKVTALIDLVVYTK